MATNFIFSIKYEQIALTNRSKITNDLCGRSGGVKSEKISNRTALMANMKDQYASADVRVF